MNYEIITVEQNGESFNHVVITREDNSQESFPVDENNSRYQQFLIDTDGGLPIPE